MITVYPTDGNAFSIIAAATRGMREDGYSEEDIKAYRERAMSGDYNNLLVETMKVVNIGFEDEELDEEMCDYCGDTLLWCECDY